MSPLHAIRGSAIPRKSSLPLAIESKSDEPPTVARPAVVSFFALAASGDAFEIIAAAIGLVLELPVMLLEGMVIRWDLRGPAMFSTSARGLWLVGES
jgi:lipopolysaccharide/colanic/teichoic acid biosynthesis glycosyltransferase